MIHHRNSYVNQIDPASGFINFLIGQELLLGEEGGPQQPPGGNDDDGYMIPNNSNKDNNKSDLNHEPRKSEMVVVDFARARENCENSASTYVRSASEYVDDTGDTGRTVPEGYINMTSPIPEEPGEEERFDFGGTKTR